VEFPERRFPDMPPAMKSNPADPGYQTARSTGSIWPLAVAVGLWATLTFSSLALRPLLPVDETRYLTVAWEMWNHGNFLVPHLNGEPYGHKTPLLFWLMHAGWILSGIGDLWPRLIAPLAGLACLFLTRALGRNLWPERPEIGDLSPLLLLAIIAWPALTTTVMFDSLLAVFVLVGLLGAVRCSRVGGWKNWALLGLGFGLGALAKGPAVLPHLLFVPLLGPLWADRDAWRHIVAWRQWWTRLGAAGLLGAIIAAAWLLPILLNDDSPFTTALFRNQIGERVVDAKDHGQALWWYVLILPPALLPIFLWPPVWCKRIRKSYDFGARFCIVWFIGAALSLSLISGKQLHYLLPSLPALALLAASRIVTIQGAGYQRSHALPATLIAILGLTIAAVPLLPLNSETADTVAEAATGWGAVLAVAAIIAAVVKIGSWTWRAGTIAALSVLSIITVHLVIAPVLATRFDLEPVALHLRAWESEGKALANYGEYHGQYHFLGRLQHPMTIVGDGEISEWVAAHPDGIVVTYQRTVPEGASPLLVHSFRGRLITIWSAEAVIRDPRIVRRSP
jgi:4-amino-4-deoxy-L-arabinose transferase-like glycosyltransferase